MTSSAYFRIFSTAKIGGGGVPPGPQFMQTANKLTTHSSIDEDGVVQQSDRPDMMLIIGERSSRVTIFVLSIHISTLKEGMENTCTL